MEQKPLSAKEREHQFYEMVVGEYLKYGSVDEVFRQHRYSLPISFAGFHRLLDRWGIVKAAGPNSKLAEAICFLTILSDRKVPLETLYKSMPPSFRTSMSTMHRILHHIKEGVTRRVGTALLITPSFSQNYILVGHDFSTPRIDLGKKFGSLSLPMGYSKKEEEESDSILRVLQQEVFTKETLERKFPYEVLPKNPEVIGMVDIADVEVSIYHIPIPDQLSDLESFSSYKLGDFQFLHADALSVGVEGARVGIKEIAKCYLGKLRESSEPFHLRSELNESLSELALDAW